MKSYQYVVEFKDKGSSNAKKFGREMGVLDSKANNVSTSMGGATVKTNRFGRELNNTQRPLSTTTSLMGGLRKAAGALGITLALSGLFTMGSRISAQGAEFEQTTIAFETMLGSAEKAKDTIADLNQFANVTPFTNENVFRGSKSLMAYGVVAEELIPTLETLGNIAAGVGMVKMPNLILAYGQVKAAGRLTGMELRQFTETGVPLLDELSKVTGKSVSVIKEELIPQGKIGFDLVKKAMEGLSAEGGRFHNLMEKQSQTFAGRASTLKGKMQLVAIQMGQSLNEQFRPFVEGSISAVDALAESMKPLTQKYDEQKSKVAQLEEETSPLIRRYEELTGKAKLNKEEQTELKIITEKLGDALPNIVTQWDKFGKAIKLSTDNFSDFKDLQKEYLADINKDALLEGKIGLQNTLIKLSSAYRKLNFKEEEERIQKSTPFAAWFDNPKFADKKARENLDEYRRLFGSESGHGELGVAINQIRELNGLRTLSPKEIGAFDGIKSELKNFGAGVSGRVVDFSKYRELLTKRFDPFDPDADIDGNGSGGVGSEDDITAGLESITAGGSRSITINMPGMKFAENIEINPQTLEEGLDDLEPQMREFFTRLLNGSLQTATQY